MSFENDITLNTDVIDYGICCDECGYEIEDGCTGYWRDNVSGDWIDVRYCGICVRDFVKQPKRVSAEQIWRRQDEARKEQERLRVPESERRRLREEREERERQSRREYEEEMEEREAERKKKAALNNILARQEVARLQKKEQEQEQECMNEEDCDIYDDRFCIEEQQSTRLTCEYTGPEEHDPRYDYDSLQSDQDFSRRVIEEEERYERSDWIQAHANKFSTPPPTLVSSDGERSRCYDWDPKPPRINWDDYDWIQAYANKQRATTPPTLVSSDGELSRCYDWDPKPTIEEYEWDSEPIIEEYDWIQANERRKFEEGSQEESVQEDFAPVSRLLFPLPTTVEELYKYLDDEVVSIVPQDAILLDKETIRYNSYEEAKDSFNHGISIENEETQELPNAYIVSQEGGRYWFVLTSTSEPTKYRLSLYIKKDEIATKYLLRKMEECIYFMDCYDYPQDYYQQIKAVCFTCGDFNDVSEISDAGRQRMLCQGCWTNCKQCCHCETITFDRLYNNLCFDCFFDKPLREQMPLEDHLQKIVAIQRLRPQYLEVLTKYAELCGIHLIRAYDYKSRCHLDYCNKPVGPSSWDAEVKTQFCCERHREGFDECGHCYEEEPHLDSICKICYSSHDGIMLSSKGIGPVASAVCMFDKLRMSNILFDSLVDLCEFYI